jgi:long-chain acyl-CoA synthetase
LYALARLMVFRPLLEKLGLDRLELLVSGGAPLSDDTMAIWQIWGVNTMQLYGQTETAGGIITGQRGWMPRPGGVGDTPPGCEVRLAASGEILVRMPDLFEGYWGQPDATREVKDADGWLHTGDAGAWVDGKLRLVDRVRDFIVTSGGKTISPSYVENLLRASHYVAEVMVIGHGMKYLTALVEIDFDAVSDWARSRNIAYTGFTSLALHDEVRGLVAAEIARANGLLARVEQVKDFRILPKSLDPEEEGEPVTPTRKVKRTLMIARFRELVDAMYDDREERLLAHGAGDVLRGAGDLLHPM